MLPSLLARDIQQGLEQFLTTGFEPSDDFCMGWSAVLCRGHRRIRKKSYYKGVSRSQAALSPDDLPA
jgi:hypothetical protein